ncbi:hypothetical protein Scel_64230 [Streptomyces cellostaticus]|nr:hypothetical protein Scel_64230 [Streptomyces cellostaticus]
MPCATGRRAREPVNIPCEAVRLTALRRLTVAGQRRNCTGFPPYGCDDDLGHFTGSHERAEEWLWTHRGGD